MHREREREREREGGREGDISFHLLLFLFPFRGRRSLDAYGESHPWMFFLGGPGVSRHLLIHCHFSKVFQRLNQ
jgi:hypothetical protein